MAINKSERMSVPINPQDDPAVTANLGPRRDDVYSKIAKARSMTPAQRAKAQRDAARSKVTYDLPADLIQQIETLAKTYKCPPSHLAALLMRQGIKAISDGDLNVLEHRITSRVPRYQFFLDTDLKAGGEK